MVDVIVVSSSDQIRNIVEGAVISAVATAIKQVRAEQKSVPPTEKYLTLQQAADRVGLSVSGLRKSISRGDIPARRFGRAVRIKESDLDRLADGPVRNRGGRPRKQG